eukprot:181812_1
MITTVKLILFICLCSSHTSALYTFWKYGGSSFNYGMLPATQQLGYDISSSITLSTEELPVYNNDYLSYPIVTSNNNILVIGYDDATDIVTLYMFDEYLSIKSQTSILCDIDSLIYSTDGPVPIYQEYNNRNYYVHHFTFVNRSTAVAQFVHLLLVLELKGNNVNVLWHFEQSRLYEPGWYGKFYQPVVYGNYVFFQHEIDYPATSIARYVFYLNNGSIVWTKTDSKTEYIFSGPPILYETNNYGVLLIFDDSSSNFYAINMKTGNITWKLKGPYHENFEFKYRNSDRYGVNIYKQYHLLFRICNAAVCVFNITNGKFVSIIAHQFEDTPVYIRSIALNTNNGHSDLILFTETKTIYYKISVNGMNVTSEQTHYISKQFRHFYWIDSESNIMYSLDGYYGNSCSKSSTREYFIVSKSGVESNSICLGLDGNYPVVLNSQISDEQYIYFTSDSKLVAVKSSIKQTENRRLINQFNNTIANTGVTVNVTESYSTTQFVTTDETINKNYNCIYSVNPINTADRIDNTSDKSDDKSSNDWAWSILGISGCCILFIICYYNLRGNRRQRRNNIRPPVQQQPPLNNDSDFYPKKPMKSGNNNHTNVEVNIQNNTAKHDTGGDLKEDNESIEMIGKQPTLSYSAMNCVICLDILLENESLKLVCGHKFHTHCIEEYDETNHLCPLCRKKIEFK